MMTPISVIHAASDDTEGVSQRKAQPAEDGDASWTSSPEEKAEGKAGQKGIFRTFLDRVDKIERAIIRLGRSWERVTLKPQYKVMIFSVVAALPTFLLGFVMPAILSRWFDSDDWLSKMRHYAVVLWFSVQFLYNFAMVQITDPGGSMLAKPGNAVTGRFELVVGTGEAGVENTLLFAPKWCEQCHHWKPPRSHHCSVCRRCTLRMEQHCMFTGCCIGARNVGHLVLMYVFALLGLLYALVVLGVDTYGIVLKAKEMLSKKDFKRKLIRKKFFQLAFGDILPQLLGVSGYETPLMIALAIPTLLVASINAAPALWNALTNNTALEYQFPMKEYVEIEPKVYCPLGPSFYGRGWRSNLRDILGARWFWRLLLPVSGGPVDLVPAVRPVAGVDGLKAVEKMREEVRTKGVSRRIGSVADLEVKPEEVGRA